MEKRKLLPEALGQILVSGITYLSLVGLAALLGIAHRFPHETLLVWMLGSLYGSLAEIHNQNRRLSNPEG